MIIQCKVCKTRYNDKTIKDCPICPPDKVIFIKKERPKRTQKAIFSTPPMVRSPEIEDYIQKHIEICHRIHQKRQCALKRMKNQLKCKIPLDPLMHQSELNEVIKKS